MYPPIQVGGIYWLAMRADRPNLKDIKQKGRIFFVLLNCFKTIALGLPLASGLFTFAQTNHSHRDKVGKQ
ncbi:hypothetical protein C9J03_09500 [Photobacterium gaetbulicola]|uniref:Uncharacterized protein n=1 Tax=Photobacterium gaetbulicola Gung47 TaxID=658445 RepID=A0A0C5WK34_9GAMM|nr:hypothetical protein H744_1c0449 [Photobacterium gaetbulicola Gung47]PSU12790.1 hypothetical protein C9J03_09500 [Photobacterium gaetbulicola]